MKALTESTALIARQHLATGCETMGLMLRGLLDSQGGVAAEIHAVRKHGKVLRGGFALFELDQSSSLEIQGIGRLLAGPRDAVSRLSTWHQLAWDGDRKLVATIAGQLEFHARLAALQPPPETIEWGLERVAAALVELHALPAASLAKRISSGFGKLTERSVKRCRKLKHRDAADFHPARKALKSWLGAVGFLPAGWIVASPEICQLTEVLGDENDLHTLSVWLRQHGFTARFAPDLWDQINGSRRKLRREIIKDAARLQLPIRGIKSPRGPAPSAPPDT